MKNDLKVINEQIVLGKEFKVYGDNDTILFLAKDVAEWIDYSYSNKETGTRKVSQMVSGVDDDERLLATIKSLDMKQSREMLFLTEDGLYEVLMLSRKPIAKAFKKEVKKILKTIRKTGGYVADTSNFIDTYFASMNEQGREFLKMTLADKLRVENELKKAESVIEHKTSIIDNLTEHLDSIVLRKTATGYVSKINKEKGKSFSEIYHIIYDLVGSFIKKDIKVALDKYKQSQKDIVMKNKKYNKDNNLRGEDRVTPFRIKDSNANISTMEYLVDVLGDGAIVLECMAKVFEVGIEDIMEKYTELS